MIGLMLAAAAAAAQPAVTIGDFRMHLFYRHSGLLSEDISPPREFTGWNTVIGEGDAEEPAEDLLVVVPTRVAGGGETFVETPLRIVARGRDNRVIANRNVALLSSASGDSYSPVWLQDIGCEGEISVTATFGDQTRSESLSLECGE